MNLQWGLAKLAAVVLLLLAASPFTAPFAVCGLADGSHSEHSPTRHLTHASAVFRPAAKVSRRPILMSLGVRAWRLSSHRPDNDRQTTTGRRGRPRDIWCCGSKRLPHTLHLEISVGSEGDRAPPLRCLRMALLVGRAQLLKPCAREVMT